MRRARVTLRDVGREAGVSMVTASRVLNGSATPIPLSQGTRDRVAKAAEELGYRPNAHARSIRTGRFDCAALVESTEEVRSVAARRMIWGIEDALAERGMHLTMARLPDEQLESEAFMLKLLARWTADGLLIHYTQEIPEGMKRLIDGYKIPAIWINSKQDHDCVHPDDLGAARAITEHLLELGHERIAYADYYPWRREDTGDKKPPLLQGHYSASDRREGYLQAMEEAGCKPILLCEKDVPEHGQRAAFSKEWLSSKRAPTAVVAYGVHATLPIMHAAGLLGMSIPGDLSIALFSDAPLAELDRDVCTMVIPEAEIGKAAVEILDKKMSAPRKPIMPVVLPLEIHEGNTTAPPGKKG